MTATAWFIIAIIGFSLAGVALIAAIFMFIKMNIPAIIGDLTGKTVAREIKAMRDTNFSSGDKRFRPSNVNLERGLLTENRNSGEFYPVKQPVAKLSNTVNKTRSGTVGLENAATYQSNVYTVPSTTGLLQTPNYNATEILSDDIVEIAANSTELLNDNATEILSDTIVDGSGATELLSSNSTEILSDNATEVLSDITDDGSGATELLSTNSTEILSDNATEVLSNNATEVLCETKVGNETTVLSQSQLNAVETPIPFVITRNLVVVHTEEVIG